MSQDKSFLGSGWAFPPTFSKQPLAVGGGGKVAMSSAEDDIRESLTILMSTTPGERIMQPAFGCGIKSHVFDSLSNGVVTEIKNLIERAVLFFEPRITLNNVLIRQHEAIDGRLDIMLDYTIRTTNTRSNMVYPFYFLEGSNVSL
jgi:phage baseplate assembly protein W